MTPMLVTVDREVVQNSFREWQAEQTLLDSQLAESVAALDAYQSHLDTWQQELAREREELQQLRATLDTDNASADEKLQQQVEQLQSEVNEAREKIASLTTALLERTEELRTLDHQREDASTGLAQARARETELAAALATEQQQRDAQREQWENELAQLRKGTQRAASTADVCPAEAAPSGPEKVELRPSASPVLGSLMEQFGKLRQQRAMNRPNPKPR